MSVDIQLKKGDTRTWTITISDASGDALSLAGATVEFQLREDEGASDTYFVRNTGGTGSDYITISTPYSDGIVTIEPIAADWTAMSDNYGIYVGEFKVTDANSVVQYTTDMVLHVQEALV